MGGRRAKYFRGIRVAKRPNFTGRAHVRVSWEHSQHADSVGLRGMRFEDGGDPFGKLSSGVFVRAHTNANAFRTGVEMTPTRRPLWSSAPTAGGRRANCAYGIRAELQPDFAGRAKV